MNRKPESGQNSPEPQATPKKLGFDNLVRVETTTSSGCGKASQNSCGINWKHG